MLTKRLLSVLLLAMLVLGVTACSSENSTVSGSSDTSAAQTEESTQATTSEGTQGTEEAAQTTLSDEFADWYYHEWRFVSFTTPMTFTGSSSVRNGWAEYKDTLVDASHYNMDDGLVFIYEMDNADNDVRKYDPNLYLEEIMPAYNELIAKSLYRVAGGGTLIDTTAAESGNTCINDINFYYENGSGTVKYYEDKESNFDTEIWYSVYAWKMDVSDDSNSNYTCDNMPCFFFMLTTDETKKDYINETVAKIASTLDENNKEDGVTVNIH